MLESPRIIDVERKPRKCHKCGERVEDIFYGTGDMKEIDFVMEYRREGIMGGDSIPRRPPIWACSCGCKRFRKVNLDGTDVPVKVKMLNRRTKQEHCLPMIVLYGNPVLIVPDGMERKRATPSMMQSLQAMFSCCFAKP